MLDATFLIWFKLAMCEVFELSRLILRCETQYYTVHSNGEAARNLECARLKCRRQKFRNKHLAYKEESASQKGLRGKITEKMCL